MGPIGLRSNNVANLEGLEIIIWQSYHRSFFIAVEKSYPTITHHSSPPLCRWSWTTHKIGISTYVGWYGVGAQQTDHGVRSLHSVSNARSHRMVQMGLHSISSPSIQ